MLPSAVARGARGWWDEPREACSRSHSPTAAGGAGGRSSWRRSWCGAWCGGSPLGGTATGHAIGTAWRGSGPCCGRRCRAQTSQHPRQVRVPPSASRSAAGGLQGHPRSSRCAPLAGPCVKAGAAAAAGAPPLRAVSRAPLSLAGPWYSCGSCLSPEAQPATVAELRMSHTHPQRASGTCKGPSARAGP